jgi:glycosyltransferase involved in cell wall biosynthesis
MCAEVSEDDSRAVAADAEGEAGPAGATRPLRAVAMGGGVNGNTDVCCRAWHDLGNSFLMVTYGTFNNDDTAFAPLTSLERGEVFNCDEHTDPQDVVAKVLAFRPDAIMCGGWNQPPAFRQVMKAMQPPVLRIMFMDAIWRSSMNQWIGRGMHRFMIDPNFDVVMVPGERSEFLARRIGFGPDDIIRGGYTGNTPLFDSGPRSAQELASRRRFLYVGRLVPFKGIDVLAQAYRQYRRLVPDPWELHVAGLGPEGQQLERIDGVTMHGFVQAPDLAALMHESSGFVLPSLGEHFGIVVHEAAAAGLPLLVSETAGAVPGFLQDGYNGWAVPEGDVAAWTRCLTQLSGQSPDRLREMSDISRALSTRISPAGWARNLHDMIQRRRAAAANGHH